MPLLTAREQEILDLVREDPLLGSDAIARRLGSTRTAVNVHLSNLTRKGAILGRGYLVRSQPHVVVIGGANMDIKAHSTAAPGPGTSNPGTTVISPGGVGRNVAENLARLGTATWLVAAVGPDAMGRLILDATERAGVRTDHVLATAPRTGTYTAVLDHTGELSVGVADMAATALVDAAAVDAARATIRSADLVVLDGNLEAETLRSALRLAEQHVVDVVVDPVSVPKARRLRAALADPVPIHTITPTVQELGALVGREVADRPRDLARAASLLHDRGVAHVWVRRGRRGSVVSSAGVGITSETTFPAEPVDVVDVTGAGDAMLAAYCHGLLAGHELRDALLMGISAATLTIASAETVRPDLPEHLIRPSRSTER